MSGSGGGGGGGGGAIAFGGLRKLIFLLLTWQKDYIHLLQQFVVVLPFLFFALTQLQDI
jgi:hypothetical protein